jgi:hypothetical protein
MTATTEPDLRIVVIQLMKGVVYQGIHERVWRQMLPLQARVRDYVSVMGLTLHVDEAEGYAFLRSRPVSEEDSDDVPRLIPRRSLSFHVSLLLALLRKKLAEFDASGGDAKLVLAREQIVEMLRTFMPESSNEARLIDQIDGHLNKAVELGFLRRPKGQDTAFEVRRILKAFVDGQWLSEFDQRLAEYADQLAGPPEAGSE